MPTLDLISGKREACCIKCENADNEIAEQEDPTWYKRNISSCFRKNNNTVKGCIGGCRGFKSIMLKSVAYSNEKFRDELIKISLHCKETEISSFVNTFDDMEALFKRSSP